MANRSTRMRFAGAGMIVIEVLWNLRAEVAPFDGGSAATVIARLGRNAGCSTRVWYDGCVSCLEDSLLGAPAGAFGLIYAIFRAASQRPVTNLRRSLRQSGQLRQSVRDAHVVTNFNQHNRRSK